MPPTVRYTCPVHINVQRNQSTQTRKASNELRFRSEDRVIACLGSGRKEKEEERVLFSSAITNESDDGSRNKNITLCV